VANPAAEACARVLAAHPEAVVVERGRNNLKHRLADAPDGRQRFALDCSIGPLHYEDGGWQEIDTAFEPSTAPWDWEMVKAGFEVRALSRLDAGQVIEYRNGSEWVRFQPMALQYSNDLDQIQPISMPGNLDAAVDDDTLTWADGYGSGVSIFWQAQTARLAKRLTINSLNDLPPVEQFILDGGQPVLELNFIFAYSKGVTPWINGEPWDKKQRNTQGLVEFRDSEGAILWWFNLPRSWDAEGTQQLGSFRFKKVGNALYISHRVPLGFVQSATYPLEVDVDIDEQVGAGADDGFSTFGGIFDATGDEVKVGYLVDVWWAADGWYRFTGISGLSGATIIAANISLYRYGSGIATPETKIFAEDAAAPAAPTSQANHAGKARTTAGVDWDGQLAADWNDSPEIKTVIQELATSYDPSVIQILHDDDKGSGEAYLTSYSYEKVSAVAAELHIEYSTGADATITAVTATAVAAALLPAITADRNIAVSAVVATATAAALLPSVITAVDVEIAGEEASAVAAAPTPSVSTGATVTATVAIAIADALTPTVAAIQNVTIAGEAAAATATAPTPTVAAIQNVEIAGELAAAIAAAPSPTVSISKTIAAAVAVATADALNPTIATTAVVEVSAVTATAVAAAPSPTIVGVEITITAVTATAVAAAPLPSILYDKTLSAVTATAVAAALLPTFTDTVYAQYGKIIAAIDPDDYPSSTTLKLLVVLWTNNAAKTVYARLYNVTDSIEEVESVVSTASTSPVEALSSALSLPSGAKTYRIDVGGVGGGTYSCSKAVVRGTV